MGRIFTIGEITYDIIFRNERPYNAVIGGSALNTSISLGRLKLPVHFISRIGTDHIGEMSARFLIENKINCENIIRYNGQSRLSIAFLDSQNSAEYQFYNPVNIPSLLFPELQSDDLVLFGSSNAISDDGRENLIKFLRKNKKKEVIVVYDPNVRRSNSNTVVKIEENFCFSTVVKASIQDFKILYNLSDSIEIFSKLQKFGVEVLILTDEENPVTLLIQNFSKKFQVKPVKAINTIGAGDNFSAGLLAGFFIYNVSKKNISRLNEDVWDKIITLGNSIASEVCLSELNYISEEFAGEISNS